MTARRRRPRTFGADGEPTEAMFQRAVIRAMRGYGWDLIYHAPDGGRGSSRDGSRRVTAGQIPEGRGFPDLVALRGTELVVAELKRHDGRHGPGQCEWLVGWDAFAAAVARAVRGDALVNGEPGRFHEPADPVVHVRTWRPADWPDVLTVLRGDRPEVVELRSALGDDDTDGF